MTLRLHVDYAVCEKMCVPVEAKAELALPGGNAETASALTAAEARVPKPVSAAEAGLTARRINDKTLKPLVFVDLAAPTGEKVQVVCRGADTGMGAAHSQTRAGSAAWSPAFRLRA